MFNVIEQSGKPTLCWNCKNTNRYKCSWFNPKKPTPVPGWIAERTTNCKYESYRVIDCPNFSPILSKRNDQDKLENTDE